MNLFAANGKLVGRIGNGHDSVNVYADGKILYGAINNSRITESESHKNFTEMAAPVLALVTSEVCHKGPMTIWHSDKDQGAMDDIKKHLDGIINESKITVLTLVPDEGQENAPREMKASGPDLERYRSALPEFSEAMSNCRNMTDSLLRTNIPRTMWGSKKIRAFLSSIRSDFDSMTDDFDRFDAAIEKSDRNVTMASELHHAKKTQGKIVVAGRLLDDFRNIKDIMSRTAQTVYRLFDADKTFKKESGYPATWFFPPSVYYDFQYNFEGLVKGLVKAASLEPTVILPLFAWRVQG